jgi:hypothetical protein
MAYTFWPRIYTLLKRFLIQRHYLSKTRTSDFIAKITRQAEKQNIPQSHIAAWKETVPQELVNAVNQGRFNGSFLSYPLLYPKYWPDSIDISSDLAENKWRNMTLILSKIFAKAKQSGVEAAMVFIPSPFMYNPGQHDEKNPWIITGAEIDKRWLTEDTEIQIRLRQWTKENDVPYLDLTPILRKVIQSNQNLNYELDGHWNNIGHQVAAEAIASWLSDQQVFLFIKKRR